MAGILSRLSLSSLDQEVAGTEQWLASNQGLAFHPFSLAAELDSHSELCRPAESVRQRTKVANFFLLAADWPTRGSGHA
jgi:hypothetical protein